MHKLDEVKSPCTQLQIDINVSQDVISTTLPRRGDLMGNTQSAEKQSEQHGKHCQTGRTSHGANEYNAAVSGKAGNITRQVGSAHVVQYHVHTPLICEPHHHLLELFLLVVDGVIRTELQALPAFFITASTPKANEVSKICVRHQCACRAHKNATRHAQERSL